MQNENIATCKSENEVVQYIKRVQQGKNIYKSPQWNTEKVHKNSEL